MKLEAIGKPFIYRWPGGEVRLEEGKPVDLAQDRAERLLNKVGDRVRVVEPIVIEPAHPNARPVYWERSTGEIVGPAAPEFLVQTGSGLKSTDYWVVLKYEGHVIWIRSDFLRSKIQFEQQVKPTVVDPIKDLR